MLTPNSGPHIIENLRNRVASLTAALERAQERINELERVFGSDAELLPLITLGLSRSQARLIHLLRTREKVTMRQAMFAIYADTPDRMDEVDSYSCTKSFMCTARRKLKQIGVFIETIGGEGYRMAESSKSTLAASIASGAVVIDTPGKPRKRHGANCPCGAPRPNGQFYCRPCKNAYDRSWRAGRRTPLPQCEHRL